MKPLQGGEARQITFGEGSNRFPSWFPDGKTLAYSSNRSGRYQIYLANLQGSSPLRITASESHHHFIAVSPDGKNMIYLLQKETGRIFSCEVQTAKEEEITSDSRLNRWPDESPDGKLFSYQSLDANDSSMNESIIIQSAGGKALSKRFESTGFDIQWAPDSERLAFFHVFPMENRWELKSFDTRDGSEKLLTTNVAWGGITRLPDNHKMVSYTWSPDGNEIAYCSTVAGISNLLKIPVGANASGAEQVSQNADGRLKVSDPCWAPRGDRIAYVLGPRIFGASGNVRSVWLAGKTTPAFKYVGWLRLLGWSSSGQDVFVALGSQGAYSSITETVTFLKLNVDSGRQTPLLAFPSVYLHSANLSRDGNAIAFVSRQGGQDNAYILLPGQRKARKLTNNGDTEVYLSGLNWSSDRKKLYYSKQSGRSQIWAFQHYK